MANNRFNTSASRGGVAIAISSSVVKPLIDANLAKQGFPGPAPTDDSLTINSLTIALDNGFIRVTGDATKQIDFLPDPNVDFEVRIGLWIKDGVLTTQVLHVDSELPWWLDALQILAPLIGTMVVNIVGEVLNRLIKSAVGGVSQDVVSDIAAFGTALPDAGGLVRVTNTGQVTIRPDGLILPGYADTIFNPRAIKVPQYTYGNDETKEFHKKDCPYFRVMKRTKQVLFINPLHALRRGYNGCDWCQGDYNDEHPGRVFFKINDASFDGVIEGRRTSPVTIGGLVVDATVTLFGLPKNLWWCKIVPGEWQFKVKDKDWEATCLVDVPRQSPPEAVRSPRDGRGALYITATPGNASCNHAIGAAPAFP